MNQDDEHVIWDRRNATSGSGFGTARAQEFRFPPLLDRFGLAVFLRLGALTSPMELSFRNLAENSSMVTLAYTFERVLECTFPPVWSHWASSQYDNSTEAWIAMASPNAEEHGVPWSSWSRVWANFVGNSSAVVGQEWEPGFSYLDTNRNGFAEGLD
eukprot:g6486.t1